jgi:hypothetical protein
MFAILCLLLQPLMDNLQSPTYEVFEKDPVKYSQYQLVCSHFLFVSNNVFHGTDLFAGCVQGID